jgi:hypothetical protein
MIPLSKKFKAILGVTIVCALIPIGLLMNYLIYLGIRGDVKY